MKRSWLILSLLIAASAWGGSARARKSAAKVPAKSLAKNGTKGHAKVQTKSPAKIEAPARKARKDSRKPTCKTSIKTKKTTPAAPPANEVAKPSESDPDRERIVRLQEALDGIVHGKVLGRVRVGMRVEDLSSGRVLYGWRSGVLMDPASNQKILGTSTALLRLGDTYRYRTEVTGPGPDVEGNIAGDIVIRGSGDPSLRLRHINAMAESLAAQGVTRVSGDVLGDPRRIGSDEFGQVGRPPLRVGSSSIEVHVRPGAKSGSRPSISIRPASDAFAIVNHAETRSRGRSRVKVEVERTGHRYQVVVSGKVTIARGEVVMRKAPANAPFFAAFLLRHALIQAGIDVAGGAGLYTGETPDRVSISPVLDGTMVALAPQSSDSPPPLDQRLVKRSAELLAVHESEPLAILLRRVNKHSDNEWAERVLETVGAEVLGGAPTTAKGVRVLRESLEEMGLPTDAFLPANGSGLGHHNRVTAAGMAALLRHIYFNPRIGPEMMQSLSVGGVDGTTRNRFRGTAEAHRVRAKTGTLTGVSCLSGYVGDGADVLVFSILVEGQRKRALPSVRAAQVSAVGAMMRFAHQAEEPPPEIEGMPSTDYETGDEVDESDDSGSEGTESSEPKHAPAVSP